MFNVPHRALVFSFFYSNIFAQTLFELANKMMLILISAIEELTGGELNNSVPGQGFSLVNLSYYP